MNVSIIRDAVQKLYRTVCVIPDPGIGPLVTEAREREASPVAKELLGDILDNIRVAGECGLPLCQDTGMAIVFLEVGQDVRLEGGYVEDAIHEGVRRARQEGCLRASVLDPLTRKNTGDNTPAIIHTRIVPGNTVKIELCAKGFGSENMSRIGMLKPSQGKEGVMDFIVDTVRIAGGNPCPPVVVGVGIGGSFERAAQMAKHALMRDTGAHAEDEELCEMEKTLLDRINALGIGPMGIGGSTTALAVQIEKAPTHIAALPVAVNIQCHCVRHDHIVLEDTV